MIKITRIKKIDCKICFCKAFLEMINNGCVGYCPKDVYLIEREN